MLSILHDELHDSGNDNPIEANDVKLNMAVGSQAREQDEEYDSRNRLYTLLLEVHIKNYRHKEWTKGIYRCIFYVVTMLLFVGIVACGSAAMVLLSIVGDGNIANVGIAIANIAGMIATLIILPKMIAEHLFPVNEEAHMLEMVKDMQENDAKIRNVLYEKKENKIE